MHLSLLWSRLLILILKQSWQNLYSILCCKVLSKIIQMLKWIVFPKLQVSSQSSETQASNVVTLDSNVEVWISKMRIVEHLTLTFLITCLYSAPFSVTTIKLVSLMG